MSWERRSLGVTGNAEIDHRCVSCVAVCILLIAGCEAQTARADVDGSWEPLASMNLARQEVGAAKIGDKVYVVGGLNGVGLQATDTVEVYDIANDEWSFVSPLPQARHHMAVASHGGLLFVIGGYTPGLFQARGEVFVYDPQQDSWSSAAPLPSARGACWGVTLNDRIYVFGGTDDAGVVQASTLIFDPVADAWSVGADMPTAREHLTASVAGDLIYVIGGRHGSSLNVNEAYDPVSDQWQTLAPMPTSRSAPAQATFDGKIYLAGGEIPQLFAIHEIYDVATDTWDVAPLMPIPRHGIAAVALDDRILVPAGGVIQGVNPTALVDSFVPRMAPVPAASTWGMVVFALAIISLATILIRRFATVATKTSRADYGSCSVANGKSPYLNGGHPGPVSQDRRRHRCRASAWGDPSRPETS